MGKRTPALDMRQAVPGYVFDAEVIAAVRPALHDLRADWRQRLAITLQDGASPSHRYFAQLAWGSAIRTGHVDA